MSIQAKRAIVLALALPLGLLAAADGAAEPATPRAVAIDNDPDDTKWIPDIQSGLIDPLIETISTPGTLPEPDSDGRPDALPGGPRTGLAPEELDISAFPNPSRGPVTVRAQGPIGIAVRVYDVGGRMVADLDGASGEAVWDGRDSGGGPAPAGVYFARVQADGAAAKSIRIVRR